MKKLSSFSQFVGESNTNDNSYFSNFIKCCSEKGMDAKYEFEKKHPYLVEDANKLFVEFSKMEGLVDFYNEIVEYNDEYSQILENNTSEAAQLIKDNNIGVFDLLKNDGGYDEYDTYLTIVDGVVVTFNEDTLPTNNKGFLEFFFYDILGMCETDFTWFMCHFYFDNSLDKEENWREMQGRHITRPFYDIMYDMYVKWCEHNGYDIVEK